MLNIISTISILGVVIFISWYNYILRVSTKKLKSEISKTHDFYREKYDFYLHFKDRYASNLDEITILRETLRDVRKRIGDLEDEKAKLQLTLDTFNKPSEELSEMVDSKINQVKTILSENIKVKKPRKKKGE